VEERGAANARERERKRNTNPSVVFIVRFIDGHIFEMIF
jgi:hypothetical protein